MPQKVIRFTGINRKVNEFQNAGACEELINIRPMASGGHGIVKTKMICERNVDYVQYYEHSWGETYNQIAVTNEGIVTWINAADVAFRDITEVRDPDVSISHVNDILVVYDTANNFQQVFKFKDGKYQKYYAAPVKLSASIDFRSEKNSAPAFVEATGYTYDDGNIMDTARWDEAASKAQSNFHASYKNGLCGAAVVGCTYVLEDGSEVWSSAFVVADSSKARENNTTRKDDKPSISNPNDLCKVTVKGVEDCRYIINFHESELEGIKKINVYSTKPVYNYKFEYISSTEHTAVKKTLDVLDLGSQLMYYQGSININGGGTLSLNFSTERYGENIMPVTAGAIERVGPNVSLNNRFHYFKSDVQHVVQEISISEQMQEIDAFTPWRAFAEIENKWVRLDDTYYFNPSETQDFIYPMSGVSNIFFEKCSQNSDGSVSDLYGDGFIVEMQYSSAYNYSYAFDVIPKIERFDEAWYDKVDNDAVNGKVHLRKESNVINVSVQNNPYAFDLNASYSFGGEINDIVTSYIPISAVEISKYPITVFTTNGIYALAQGSGGVLYGGIEPLQPLVIDGKATSTPHGIFFASSSNLYMLTGGNVANISYVLDGEVEAKLKEVESYKILCNNKYGGFHDFSDFLSTDFKSFIKDVSMVYDQLHNELIISSNDNSHKYSYVLNLDTKSYHTISRKYLRPLNGTRYAVEISNGVRSLVDLFEESHGEIPILIQSRPVSLELLYTHIHRLMLMADAELENRQFLCVSVFAGDDLNKWKCIISAQKKDTVFRQIRTNRAAKSYKDYVILITGVVDSKTDISDIIADYTVVNRRLG